MFFSQMEILVKRPISRTPALAKRVLLIEDDVSVSQALMTTLSGAGFEVFVAETGMKALWYLSKPLDFVIVKSDLPGCSAQKLIDHIRGTLSLPILVVTEETEQGGIDFLEYGADDFLLKPFTQSELLARSRALLMRVAKSKKVEHRGLVLDELRSRATVDGTDLALTGREFEVLRVLESSRGHLVSRDEVAWLIWEDPDAAHRRVDLYVSRLRTKLKSHTSSLEIQSIRGKGYILCKSS